jgi:hypothetical protein
MSLQIDGDYGPKGAKVTPFMSCHLTNRMRVSSLARHATPHKQKHGAKPRLGNARQSLYALSLTALECSCIEALHSPSTRSAGDGTLPGPVNDLSQHCDSSEPRASGRRAFRGGHMLHVALLQGWYDMACGVK